MKKTINVLILVLVEDGLEEDKTHFIRLVNIVLILVLVEDGLEGCIPISLIGIKLS